MTAPTNTTPIDFTTDLFTLRRSNVGSGNPYDPESLLTGAELEAGFDYDNSHREYPTDVVKQLAYEGKIPSVEIPILCPRVFNDKANQSAPAILAEGLADVSEADVLEAFSD